MLRIFSVPAFAVRQVFWLWFSSTLLEVLDCWASSSSPSRLAGSTSCPCRPGSLAMNFDWCHWISIVGNFDWTLEVHPKEFDWWFMKFTGGAKKCGWLPSCVCFWEIDSKFDFIIWFSIGSFGQSCNLRAKQETVEHCQKHFAMGTNFNVNCAVWWSTSRSGHADLSHWQATRRHPEAGQWGGH